MILMLPENEGFVKITATLDGEPRNFLLRKFMDDDQRWSSPKLVHHWIKSEYTYGFVDPGVYKFNANMSTPQGKIIKEFNLRVQINKITDYHVNFLSSESQPKPEPTVKKRWCELQNRYYSEDAWNEKLCVPPIYGCTDPSSSNFNPLATANDGSCSFQQITPPEEDDPNGYPPNGEEETGMSTVAKVGIGTGVVALGLGVLYLLFRKKK